MYTSLLLGAGALAWTSRPIAAWVLWSALALVLFTKATLEDHGMRERHNAYDAYMSKTVRLLPWLV